MEDLFRSYWWLLFPLGWFVASGWTSWLNYRKHRDTLDIVKTFADSGRDIPAGLLDKLTAPATDDNWDSPSSGSSSRSGGGGGGGFGGWSQVVLFGSLAAAFGYAAATDIYGAGPAFVIVAFVMGAVSLSALVATLTRRPKG
jgi:hypothetical protein